jgi:predicted nuclease of predicted toxin-antitoxin system
VKLLLDEMRASAIARELRARGHDAEAVAGRPDCEALSDPEVLAIARSEHRALVTDNLRDFRPLRAEAITPGGPGHYGMIFIPGGYRRTRAHTGKIVAVLEAVLAAHPGEADLADGEAWL